MAIGLREKFFPRPAAAETDRAPSPASTRVDALDGIRGIAIGLVIVTHCGWDLPWWGSTGVDMFFVLSGYLITVLLLEERIKFGRISFKNFYARRFLRLFPALMVVILAFLIFARITHLRMIPVLKECALALFYSANWARAYDYPTTYLSHTWSLSLEEQFYFLWPALALLIYRVLGRTRKGAVFCLLSVYALMHWSQWLGEHGASGVRLYSGLDTHGNGLLYGAAIGFFMPRIGRVLAAVLAWSSAVALLVILLLPPISTTYLYWATLGFIISIVNAPGALFPRLLSFPPLAWLGKISYGLYLYHFPITLYLSYYHFWKPLGTTLVAVPLALFVAALSYYALERPCLRLKSRFRTSALHPSTPQALPEPIATP